MDFFRALNVDNASAVRALLQRGFDPNSRDERGQTALYLALREGNERCVALLLAQPQLQVDAVNSADETALMMAALRGRSDWAQALVARGAAINRPGWTPLHYAASGPQADTVAWLLKQGAAVDALAPNGNTPLMMAARYGSEAMVEQLLAAGANRRLRNQRGQDAADMARGAGRETLADRLARP